MENDSKIQFMEAIPLPQTIYHILNNFFQTKQIQYSFTFKKIKQKERFLCSFNFYGKQPSVNKRQSIIFVKF